MTAINTFTPVRHQKLNMTNLACVAAISVLGVALLMQPGNFSQVVGFLESHYVELINFTVVPSIAIKILSTMQWAYKNGATPPPKNQPTKPQPIQKRRRIERSHISDSGHLTLLAEKYNQPSSSKVYESAIQLLQEMQRRSRPPLIASKMPLPLATIKPHKAFAFSLYL